MKVYSASNEFDYSWAEVSTANWRKYCPWNEKTPHVLAVDTLSRNVDSETGILRTERLITCQQNAPKWMAPFIGSQNTSYVFETSYVDPKAQRVTMCSQNMTWSDLLSVQETVVYRPSESNKVKTEFDQTARITALCGGWDRIKAKVEQFTVDRFAQNAAKGREGFEMVLEMSRRAFAQEREQQARVEAKL